MRRKILLLALLPLLALVSCGKEDSIRPVDDPAPPEGIFGTWASTDQSTETCYQGTVYGWTSSYKDHYFTLTLRPDSTYQMELNLQPDADNLVSGGKFSLAGDTLRLEDDYDCLIAEQTPTSMVLEWTYRILGCGADLTYYEHICFLRQRK